MKYKNLITLVPLITLLLISGCSEAFGQQQKRTRKRRATLMTRRLAEQIAATARCYGLDPQLVLEVMRRESTFNPKAKSHAGAKGLMQMMPKTAARFGVADPYDPEQAIHGGCRYLVFLMQRFNGRLDLVLAAYNAGEQAVEKYGCKIPPYPETQNYVRSILVAYKRALEVASGAKPQWFNGKRRLSNEEIHSRLTAFDRRRFVWKDSIE
jgi:soluble lytic murein transglycosylase-like protein